MLSEYDLMVTQQQMLLDYQLEMRKAQREAELRQRQCPSEVNAAPQIVFTAATSQPLSSINVEAESDLTNQDEAKGNTRCIKQLSDLTVAELKCECKTRQLAVGGAKPALLARLCPYSDEIVQQRQQSKNDTQDVSIIQRYLQQNPPTTPVNSSYAPSDSSSGVISDIGQHSPSEQKHPCQVVGNQLLLNTPTSTMRPASLQLASNTVTPVTYIMSPRPSKQQLVQSTNGQQFTIVNGQCIQHEQPVSLHERMLKHQQIKILELQRELGKSQEQLRHQQNIIDAARSIQLQGVNNVTQMQQQQMTSLGINDADIEKKCTATRWLSQIDVNHLENLQNRHVMQFNILQQNFQSQMQTQVQLVNRHHQLFATSQTATPSDVVNPMTQLMSSSDNDQVEQSCREVISALSENPRTALLLTNVLRENKSEFPMVDASESDCEHYSPSQFDENPLKRKIVNSLPIASKIRKGVTLDDQSMAPVYEAVFARAQRELVQNVKPDQTHLTEQVDQQRCASHDSNLTVDYSTHNDTTDQTHITGPELPSLFTPPLGDDVDADIDRILSQISNGTDVFEALTAEINEAPQIQSSSEGCLLDWLDLIGQDAAQSSSRQYAVNTSNPVLAQPTF